MSFQLPLPFFICALGFVYFHFTAFLVHAIWILPFVERRGGRTAGFTLYLLTGSGLMRDYREALAICRRLGRRPWFVRLFQALEFVAVLLLIGAIVAAIWTE
jgi:hypothetical protein